MSSSPPVKKIRDRLIEVGGRTTQDLGLGRIVGQILVLLYLTPSERSLDEIARELGLSKAAISIATRQLESLGMLQRSWKQRDRKTYYRTADDIATALHQGLLNLVQNKMSLLAAELQKAENDLKNAGIDQEAAFLVGRVKRAQKLRDIAVAALGNPIVRLLTRIS